MTTVYFAKQTQVFSPGPSGNYIYHNLLWETDGTTVGTFQIADVSANRNSGYSIHLFASYGSEAIFTPADGDTYADNLWISDGTAAGTVPVKTPAATSSNPTGATSLNGNIIFAAQGGSAYNLWTSDGTPAGTTSLATLFSQPGIKSISDVTVIGGVMYFIANYQGADTLGNPNGTYTGSLWKTDGTAAGTVQLSSLGTYDAIRSHLGTVKGLGTELLFWRDTTTFSNAPQLWQVNGTTTSLRMSFASGATRTGSDFTSLGFYAYFVIDDGAHGTELWKTRSSSVSNGAEAQTTLVADIALGATGSNPSNLTASNGWLFFTANDGTHGTELWKTNGGTTTLVQDIRLGGTGSTPTNLTDVNGTLFFTADDGFHGRELWKTNGGGATLITDIAGSSSPTNLTNVNGLLYFEAIDGTGKYGLFRSDGTTAGTFEIATDVDPIAGISFEKIGVPIIGTTGNNILTGTSDGEFIDGNAGNDTLYGLAGGDTMVGGVGNDLIIAGAGNDYAYAGDGVDSMYGGAGNDILVGGVGYNLLEGDDGNDYLYVYNGGGNLYGGAGNDVEVGNLNFDILNGDAGDDVLFMYGGNDYAYGGDGNDVMYGGDGVDVLLGGAGNDYFDGGTGVNYYFGGGGNNTFASDGTPSVQVVQDWDATSDTVQMSSTGFTSFADVLSHSYQNGAYFVVQVDGDTAVWLNGATAGTLTAANFSIVS